MIWISKKKWNDLLKRISALEKREQERTRTEKEDNALKKARALLRLGAKTKLVMTDDGFRRVPIDYEREEIQKQIMESEWKPIDTIAVLDALLKEIVTSDKNLDICYPIALVNAIKSLIPLVDEDYKKENEGLMRVLITDREQLLRLYRNRQGTSS